MAISETNKYQFTETGRGRCWTVDFDSHAITLSSTTLQL